MRAFGEMLARLMLWSERGTMTGAGRDLGSVSFKKIPWFHRARKPGIIPALTEARHPRSLRLAVQDVALSRLKRGFDSPRERQLLQRVARVGVVSEARRHADATL